MRFALPLLCLTLAACSPVDSPSSPTPSNHTAQPLPPPGPGQTVLQFSITGMHCDGCASGLKSELARLPGVAGASVDFATARARVLAATNQLTVTQILAAVEEAGFKGALVTP